MKNVALVAFATIGFASAGMAFDASIDVDGDGLLSAAEMITVYPDITEATFQAVDVDQDGFISEEELNNAVEAGVLTT